MRYILSMLCALTAFCVSACTQASESTKNNDMDKKRLVVYFSATGTTENVAQKIASVAGADLMEIEPVQPYTDADLNWNNRNSRSSVEMRDPKSRPQMKPATKNVADYDVVFIGYPIWWDLAPTIVNTFIESSDLKGKVVVPFATSGGSGIRHSVSALKTAYPDIDWREGRLLNSPSEKSLAQWIEGMKL